MVVQTLIAFTLNQALDPYFRDKTKPVPQLQIIETLGQNCDNVGVNSMQQIGATEVHQQHQVFEYFGTAGRAMFTMFELTLAQPGGKI